MTLAVRLRTHLSAAFSLDVEFDAAPGVTILFGASGSGKTTVLRCVAGLARPDGGRVAVGDQTLFDSATGVDVAVQRRKVGYVSQQLALFPHLSVASNIAYGLGPLTGAELQRRVASIAESFQIAHVLDRRPSQTSGGEQQRTALARALVTDPSMLLLDEPLSALDHANQSRIMEDLRRWNATHRIPILYVTHNHREVFALGDRVIVLEGGRVVGTGSPHEVLDQPGREALVNLAGFENVFDAVVAERRDAAGTMQCRLLESETELEVPLGAAPVGAAVRVAIRAGDILVASEPPRGLSARNVLEGEVVGLRREGATMVAVVQAGSRFLVHLTPTGATALGLSHGRRVWLIVKTYSCRLAAG